jgi:hypothetical protein
MYRDEPRVTIATFETEVEASLARGALEAIGISAMVPGEDQGSFGGMYRSGSGRGELRVFQSDRDRALVELRRLQIRIIRSD